MVKRNANSDGFYGDLFETKPVSPRVFFLSGFYPLMNESFSKLHTELKACENTKNGVYYCWAEDLNYTINNIVHSGYESHLGNFIIKRAGILDDHSKLEIIQGENNGTQMADLFGCAFTIKNKLSRFGSYVLTGTWFEDGPFKNYWYKDIYEKNFAPDDSIEILKKETMLLYAIFFFMCPGKSKYDLCKYVYENLQLRLYDQPFFCGAAARMGSMVNKFSEHKISDFGKIYEVMFSTLFGRDFMQDFYEIFTRNIEIGKKTNAYYRHLRPEYLFILTKFMNEICDEADGKFANYFYNLRRHKLDFGPNSRKKADVTNIHSLRKFQGKPDTPNLSDFFIWIKKEGVLLKNTMNDEYKKIQDISVSPLMDNTSRFLYNGGPAVKKTHRELKKSFFEKYQNMTVLSLTETFKHCQAQKKIRELYPNGTPEQIMARIKIKEH